MHRRNRFIGLFIILKFIVEIGFKTCDNFNITTADGRNFDAFMGIELSEGSLKGIRGKFYASDVFDNIPKDEVEEYNNNFPKLKKLRFPGQWD